MEMEDEHGNFTPGYAAKFATQQTGSDVKRRKNMAILAIQYMEDITEEQNKQTLWELATTPMVDIDEDMAKMVDDPYINEDTLAEIVPMDLGDSEFVDGQYAHALSVAQYVQEGLSGLVSGNLENVTLQSTTLNTLNAQMTSLNEMVDEIQIQNKYSYNFADYMIFSHTADNDDMSDLTMYCSELIDFLDTAIYQYNQGAMLIIVCSAFTVLYRSTNGFKDDNYTTTYRNQVVAKLVRQAIIALLLFATSLFEIVVHVDHIEIKFSHPNSGSFMCELTNPVYHLIIPAVFKSVIARLRLNGEGIMNIVLTKEEIEKFVDGLVLHEMIPLQIIKCSFTMYPISVSVSYESDRLGYVEDILRLSNLLFYTTWRNIDFQSSLITSGSIDYLKMFLFYLNKLKNLIDSDVFKVTSDLLFGMDEDEAYDYDKDPIIYLVNLHMICNFIELFHKLILLYKSINIALENINNTVREIQATIGVIERNIAEVQAKIKALEATMDDSEPVQKSAILYQYTLLERQSVLESETGKRDSLVILNKGIKISILLMALLLSGNLHGALFNIKLYVYIHTTYKRIRALFINNHTIADPFLMVHDNWRLFDIFTQIPYHQFNFTTFMASMTGDYFYYIYDFINDKTVFVWKDGLGDTRDHVLKIITDSGLNPSDEMFDVQPMNFRLMQVTLPDQTQLTIPNQKDPVGLFDPYIDEPGTGPLHDRLIHRDHTDGRIVDMEINLSIDGLNVGNWNYDPRTIIGSINRTSITNNDLQDVNDLLVKLSQFFPMYHQAYTDIRERLDNFKSLPNAISPYGYIPDDSFIPSTYTFGSWKIQSIQSGQPQVIDMEMDIREIADPFYLHYAHHAQAAPDQAVEVPKMFIPFQPFGQVSFGLVPTQTYQQVGQEVIDMAIDYETPKLVPEFVRSHKFVPGLQIKTSLCPMMDEVYDVQKDTVLHTTEKKDAFDALTTASRNLKEQQERLQQRLLEQKKTQPQPEDDELVYDEMDYEGTDAHKALRAAEKKFHQANKSVILETVKEGSQDCTRVKQKLLNKYYKDLDKNQPKIPQFIRIIHQLTQFGKMSNSTLLLFLLNNPQYDNPQNCSLIDVLTKMVEKTPPKAKAAPTAAAPKAAAPKAAAPKAAAPKAAAAVAPAPKAAAPKAAAAVAPAAKPAAKKK